MPSPNRKTVKTYLTSEEYAQLSSLAHQTGLSKSTFIKRVCLGIELRSKIDQQAVLNLLKANADLGRLGGLLKFALTGKGSDGPMSYEFRQTLHKIEASQAEVVNACLGVVNSIKNNSKRSSGRNCLLLD